MSDGLNSPLEIDVVQECNGLIIKEEQWQQQQQQQQQQQEQAQQNLTFTYSVVAYPYKRYDYQQTNECRLQVVEWCVMYCVCGVVCGVVCVLHGVWCMTLHCSFFRFFNYDEKIVNKMHFDWNTATASYKIDGSIAICKYLSLSLLVFLSSPLSLLSLLFPLSFLPRSHSVHL